VSLFAIGATAELWPPGQPLYFLPLAEKNQAWLDWLGATPPETVIACVPFPKGMGVEDYQNTTVWMMWGAYHQRRMVNGYSGFFPPAFLKLKDAMNAFPDAASLDALAAAGVDYCVVARGHVAPSALTNPFGVAGRLKLSFADDAAQVEIYRLAP
jgi:hypothetical protein